METLKLSVETLEWAASQVGSSLGELAQKISKKKAEVIERGELTPPQALKFSQFAGIPFGFLFLDAPPNERKKPLADFRTLVTPTPLSRDFFEVFDDIEFKQTWYRDYLQAENAAPLAFVGMYAKSSANATTIASNMRKVLVLSDAEIQAQRNSEDLFNLIARKSEASGILIFKNGVVGNNTRRVLSVSEFRGFVIADKFAPVIFINGADAPAATVFTLAHELAHLWIGESVISDVAAVSEHRHESFCNQIAAEFLLPAHAFQSVWNESVGDETARIELLRKRFKLSRYVIARRALEMNLISARLHNDIYKQTVAAAKKKKADSSGGDFYATLPIRNSRKLTSLISAMAVKGRIGLREAANLLNTNPNNVITFYGKR
ncbi:ImmA/IrrE family metallo-endopeptidase [Herbaspirillum frisingense]|uniref:Zn-dependent peptidase ImmA (M78 family) n=1 Tax=Herbaspirillum frisingense TaxID=92645 RepID=A0ABU1PKZ1_9BURK|nr:ImmA/IrrE family metallo-endopeptidase [Herbaspirillum frisingense]MDR6586360.1 Zn-dependent peptidase ImmA (M78 family) [Herbaspirillum frisingense]